MRPAHAGGAKVPSSASAGLPDHPATSRNVTKIDRCDQHERPVERRQRPRPEHRLHPRHVDDREHDDDSSRAGEPVGRVGEGVAGEQSVLVAALRDAEQLAHHHRDVGHRRRLRDERRVDRSGERVGARPVEEQQEVADREHADDRPGVHHVADAAQVDDVHLRVARRALHHPTLLGVAAERGDRQQFAEQVDREDLQHVDRERQAGDRREREARQVDDQFGRVRGETAEHALGDVRVDHPALFDRPHERREAVVEKDDLGGLLRDVGARDPHRDADARVPQRRGVVDAVAGDRHDVARALHEVDDARLVLGVDAAEDRAAGAARARAPRRRSSRPVRRR